MRHLLASILFVLLLSTPAQAAPSAAHLAAAERLLEVMNTAQVMEEALERMLVLQMETNPALKPFEGVMREFFGKYFTWEALRGDISRIYADAFSEKELKLLHAFYKTPVGRKSARLMPELAAQGSEVGKARVLEHQAELMEMLQAQMTAAPQ